MIQSAFILHTLAALLFCVGLLTLLLRRNTLVMLMGVELMLNGVNLSFITFARQLNDLTGQTVVIFIIALAACESAIGLAIFINFFRNFGGISTKVATTLRAHL